MYRVHLSKTEGVTSTSSKYSAIIKFIFLIRLTGEEKRYAEFGPRSIINVTSGAKLMTPRFIFVSNFDTFANILFQA